jgi:23S rRNA pseudouridine1911/1915/1917 synthase
VLCRTRGAKEALQQQFRARKVHRRYLALVHGHCRSQTLSSRLVTDRGDGRRGSTQNPLLGREAVTHVRLLERFSNASLVECRLETGRTHQIRIQLSEAGHPLVGERVYVRNHDLPPGAASAQRQMLHASELGFVHPATGRTLTFSAPLPEDMERVLRELRRRGR